LGGGVLEIAHLVDHKTPHSPTVQLVQLGAGSVGGKRGDAARASPNPPDRIQRTGVIVAINGGLRNDNTIDVQGSV